MVDLFGADVSGSAGAVLDDHRLAPFARQPVADNSWNRVGRSSGRKWDDDFYGTVRIITGERRHVTMRAESQKQRQDGQFTANGESWRRAGHSNSSRCRFTPSSLSWRRLVFAARQDSLNAQASEAFFPWDNDAAAAHRRDHWRRNWRAVRRERADRLRLRCFRL